MTNNDPVQKPEAETADRLQLPLPPQPPEQPAQQVGLTSASHICDKANLSHSWHLAGQPVSLLGFGWHSLWYRYPSNEQADVRISAGVPCKSRD